MRIAGKTFWLIGASEGLGRALAPRLAAAGGKLVLSARSLSRLHDIDVVDAKKVVMDVTDFASVQAAVAQVGEIDGVIYCAGAYDPVTAQDWQVDTALRMMDVNVLGAMRILPEVLPNMRERNAGQIVLIGSLSAYHGLPGAIGYGASKAALMHLAENLYLDLKKTGVTVQIINPGFIKTRLTEKNSFKMAQLMTPDAAAQHVVKAMERGRFRTAFPYPFALFFRLIRMLPDRWVRWFF